MVENSFSHRHRRVGSPWFHHALETTTCPFEQVCVVCKLTCLGDLGAFFLKLQGRACCPFWRSDKLAPLARWVLKTTVGTTTWQWAPSATNQAVDGCIEDHPLSYRRFLKPLS